VTQKKSKKSTKSDEKSDQNMIKKKWFLMANRKKVTKSDKKE